MNNILDRFNQEDQEKKGARLQVEIHEEGTLTKVQDLNMLIRPKRKSTTRLSFPKSDRLSLLGRWVPMASRSNFPLTCDVCRFFLLILYSTTPLYH
jgi:hypothetical protein